MDLSTLLDFIVAVVLAIWGIYQVRVTTRLEQEVYRLNTELDQSIQLLHRAREAVIKMHSSHIYILQFNQFRQDPGVEEAEKFAEMSAYWAELVGLAIAIGDKELLDLVNQGYQFEKWEPNQRRLWTDEAIIRGKSQQLHARISQLLAEATKRNEEPKRRRLLRP